MATRFFYNEAQNFEIYTQTAIRFSERNREFSKLYQNGQFVFPTMKNGIYTIMQIWKSANIFAFIWK